MRYTAKSRRKAEDPVDLQSVIDDLSALKTEFATVIGQIKSGSIDHASDRAEQLLTRLSDRASELYETVSEQGAHSVEAVRGQVTERPLTAVLIAFGLGFILSRLVLR
jgi:ElaB/YqjD/DUF883 family membrane-anchored ribosome-binding protein